MKKLILNFQLVVIALLISAGANAAGCYTNVGNAVPSTVIATQSPIIVQRDTPVGTVIGTYKSTAPSKPGAFCTAGEGGFYFATSLFSNATNIENVYETNVPGVGISIDNYQSYYTNPERRQVIYTGSTATYQWGQQTVTLIKIGPITSGLISSGKVAQAMDDAHVEMVGINFIGSTVTQVACSIETPVIQVPLDDVMGSTFTGVGSTAKPKVFNVGLECDAGARVNVKLSGERDTNTRADGVLQLTNAGSTDVASGVGIQILYNNNPISFDNNIILRTSAGGQETFPFVAQYYQTKSELTAGEANATATLNVSYQ